ncbi:GAF domain-containing protein [Desulfobacter sp.]|uniref:GAF domain-containing protein n=1 Tax=Desulfobacter sp. TaxID=2294 RepID=UPI003D0D2190
MVASCVQSPESTKRCNTNHFRCSDKPKNYHTKHESNRTPVIIKDTQKSDLLQYPEKAQDEGIRGIVSLPINIRGKVIGALRIYHSKVWDLSEEELSFLEVLTHNVGMALMYFRLSTTVQEIKESVNEIHDIWL